jgi:hypothetical protein
MPSAAVIKNQMMVPITPAINRKLIGDALLLESPTTDYC